ncbi:hypothetical protein ACFLY2_01830 [Patescibacteria group bacterium]
MYFFLGDFLNATVSVFIAIIILFIIDLKMAIITLFLLPIVFFI